MKYCIVFFLSLLLSSTVSASSVESNYGEISIDSIIAKEVKIQVDSAINDFNEKNAKQNTNNMIYVSLVTLLLITLGSIVPWMNNRKQVLAFERAFSKIINQIKFKEISDESDEISELLSKALNEESIDGQIDLYSKVLNIDSENIVALNGRGSAFLIKEEFDYAIRDFDRAIMAEPHVDFLYVSRGIAFEMSKQYDRAISDYDKAIELNPNYVDAYLGRGRIYQNTKSYDKAILDYNKAIELQPSSESAYYFRGCVYDDIKEHDKAIADYTKAIELKPDFAVAYNNRGYAYDIEYDKAINDFNKAIELNPNNSSAYTNRGYVYREKGDNDKAIADFDKAIELNSRNANPYNHRGYVFFTQKEYEKAIEDYDKAIELKPEYAEAYYNRGLYYEMTNNIKKALDNLSKGLVFAIQQNDTKLIKKIENKKEEYEKKLKTYNAENVGSEDYLS